MASGSDAGIRTLGGSVRRIGFALRDAAFAKDEGRILPHLSEIRRIQSAAVPGMRRSGELLRECLDSAAADAEFYAGYAGRELREFPVMDKFAVNANLAALRSRRFPDASALHRVSTSGSTGTPFSVLQDRGKRARVIAELKYWLERVGCPSHERTVYYRVHCHHSRLNMFFSNVWQTEVLDFEPSHVRRYHEAQRGAVAVMGYASMLEVLVGKWLEMGLRGDPGVRAVVSGAEFLLPRVRRMLQEFWPNAIVVSRYSNMENGILAQETGVPGVYDLCWSSYWFEILKFDSDEPAPAGETGRIVVTDMFNRAQPMIRYDTGDIGRLETGGDGWPRLVDLAGRRVDLLYDTGGEVISPYLAVLLIQDLPALVQWQIVQEGEKNYRLVLVSSDCRLTRKAAEEQFPVFRRTFGEDAEFVLTFSDEIPSLDSRKRKQFLQKWKRI